jgi:hypothetical protein
MKNMSDFKEATAVDYKAISGAYGVKGGEGKTV